MAERLLCRARAVQSGGGPCPSRSILSEVNHQLESRMREIRLSGSEGGGAEFNRLSLPLFKTPSPCPLPGGEGEAKAIAAAKVGLSKPTAEKAVVVVQKIDEAEAAGDAAKANELRQELNEGTVTAAHRRAVGQADGPSHKPATSPQGVLDEYRQRVPEGLRVVFEGRAEFDELAKLLQQVSRRARRLTQYITGAYIPFDELKLDLDNAARKLRSARPHL